MSVRRKGLASTVVAGPVLAAAVLGAVVLAACAGPQPVAPGGVGAPGPASHGDPGVLHPPSEFPGAFLDRQTITARYGDWTARFDAVLQKRGDELVLLGLTPFGSRAFVLKQVGLDVTYESFVPQELPFPPRYILFDVHRVFFGGALGGAAPPDGDLSTTRDGEILSERWQGGRLLRRRFRRANGEPPGEIVVDYDGGMPPGGPPPPHITFANGWYGYRLDITTVSHQAL